MNTSADSTTVRAVADAIRSGSRRHIARAITRCESGLPAHRAWARELLQELGSPTPPAHRIGITGVPGAGKSTLIDALGMHVIEQGHRVAVLAVDPSSTKTGGSVLGDRTRMGQLANHDNAFVRPSPTAGHLGGVARATREAMVILEAAGYDVVFVETVGVGQSEVAVADMVDTFLLVALARSGDQLQGIKRGILEMADAIAVNKADGEYLPAARVAARELSGAMRMLRGSGQDIPVLPVSAHTGMALDELWTMLRDQWSTMVAAETLMKRRATQHESWMWALAEQELLAALHRDPGVRDYVTKIEADLAASVVSAPEAAAQLLRVFRQEPTT